MIDYFEIYKACLEVFGEYSPKNVNELLKYLSSKDVISETRKKVGDDDSLVTNILAVVDNLLDDQLIKGNRTIVKIGHPVYNFSGLTTLGQKYLISLKDPTLKEKIINTIKEDGIPIDIWGIPNISKAIAKIFL